MCIRIFSKKMESSNNLQVIETFINYLETDGTRFLTKKWILRASEAALKYGKIQHRSKIVSLFKENSTAILCCLNGKRLLFKIFKYCPREQTSRLFKELKPKILKFQLKLKSVSLSNKTFDLFSNSQKRDVLALFLKLDPNSPEFRSIFFSNEPFSKLYPNSYLLFIESAKKLIKVCIKYNALNLHFLAFFVFTLFPRIPSNDALTLIRLFTPENVLDVFSSKFGVAVVCWFLRICSEEAYNFVLNNIFSYVTAEYLTENFSLFLVSSLFRQNQRSLYDKIILNYLKSNLSYCLDNEHWCRLVSHILQPKNRKLLTPFFLSFIEHCDSLSETPSSSDLYFSFASELIPLLVEYFEKNMQQVLSCNFRSNLLIQLVQLQHNSSDGCLVDLKALYSRVASLAASLSGCNAPLFSIKQVNWTIIKLLFEDFDHGHCFLRTIVSSLDKDTVSIWLQHKPTSFILQKITEKGPSDLKNVVDSLIASC